MIPKTKENVGDLRVELNGKEFYLVQFPVGDWSGDGHGKCHYFTVRSNKPVDDIREAHFDAEQRVGFGIEEICPDYTESSIRADLVEKIEGLGFSFDGEKFDREEGGVYTTPEGILDVWLYTLNQVDPSLGLEELRFPGITFYGSDQKGRLLESPGYGVFE